MSSNQSYLLPASVLTNLDPQVVYSVAVLEGGHELIGQVNLDTGDDGNPRFGQREKHREIGVAEIKEQ